MASAGDYMDIIEFINRNYIDGIVNDSSYNHIDMFTYVIILFAAVYAVLKLLNRLGIKIDEDFVVATIPYVFLGSVFRVVEDAELLAPPFRYLFITPLIFFLIFAICFSVLISARFLESKGKIRDYLHLYSGTGYALSIAGIAMLIFGSKGNFNPGVFVYCLLPAVALTGIIVRLSPFAGMVYLRSRVYSIVVFSFLLDSVTTYVGVDILGYTNKHPFSGFLTSIAGTGAVLVPLSLGLVLLVILLLEKERGGNEDEKYMLILTMIVLGFSMGARNLLAMVFGV